MSTDESTTMMDRLVSLIPGSYRREVSRIAARLRDRLPPVMIERRIDALERHVERRFTDLEAKLDEVLRRITSRAA